MTSKETNDKSKLKTLWHNLRPYKPYLRLHLDLGFLRLHTDVMTKYHEMYAFKYIELKWAFFKWSGEFTLYKPGEDIKKW